MKERDAELFLKSLSFDSKIEFLEEAKSKNEIEKIAQKAGIVYPASDLGFFKSILLFTDQKNLNGCILPKEEVAEVIGTLLGKPINKDHFRKQVIGHILDAKLEDDKVIIYATIYKSCFPDDYDTMKELFDSGNMKISFEAFGERTYKEDGSYELKRIWFVGAGLMFDSKPAFPGAEVLEVAKKERVLEMAKIMTPPEKFLHISENSQLNKGGCQLSEQQVKELHTILMFLNLQLEKERDATKKLGLIAEVEDKLFNVIYPQRGNHRVFKVGLEESKYHIYDHEQIIKALSEVDCPSCGEKGCQDIMMMDYEMNKAKTKCYMCGGESMVNMTPEPKLTKKGRQIKEVTDLAYKGKIENIEKYIKEFEGPDIALEVLLEQSIKRPLQLTNEQRAELTDEDFAIVATAENKKIRILPIHDLDHIIDSSSKVNESQVESLIGKLGSKKDVVKRKISRRSTNWAMKELLEKYKKGTAQEVIQEIAKVLIGRELNVEELERAFSIVTLKATKKMEAKDNTSLNAIPNEPSTGNPTSLQNASITEEEVKASIEEATKKEITLDPKDTEIAALRIKLEASEKKLKEATDNLTQISTKLSTFEAEKAEKEKSEKEALIKARKDELGDFAKEMKDEDILDETKYELTKLKKENAELRAGKPVTIAAKPDLTVGSKDKSDKVVSSQKKINEIFKSSLAHQEQAEE